MQSSEIAQLKDRIDRLERQLRDVLARLAQVERASLPRNENPVDRAVVREKVTYDWQD